MTDTLTRRHGVRTDTSSRYRLRRDAINTVKHRHQLRDDEAVWTSINVSRRTFYRLLAGFTADCPCKAESIARKLGVKTSEAFEVTHRDRV